MPELPEVECTRQSLIPALAGRRIVRARLFRRDVMALPSDPPGGWSRTRAAGEPGRVRPVDMLAGETIASVERHGKQIAIVGAGGRALVVALGMSGRLRAHEDARAPAAEHRHAAWWIDGGGRVDFVDPRRFGGLWAIPDRSALDARWRALGPDALTISDKVLAAGLAGGRRAVKAALLDQAVLAGVGNIYADEALHAAGIHPLRPCGGLRPGEIRAIAAAIRGVLSAAVEAGGTTLRDYADATGRAGGFASRHAVYGRGGEPCVRCGASLHAGRVGQRATVWCAVCQSAGHTLSTHRGASGVTPE